MIGTCDVCHRDGVAVSQSTMWASGRPILACDDIASCWDARPSRTDLPVDPTFTNKNAADAGPTPGTAV